MKKIIGVFAFLILLTPLGLLAPGGAWGEWGLEEIKQMKGFVPEGMNRFSGIIRAILPDYTVPGLDKNFFQTALGYIISALVGIASIAVIFWLLARLLPGQNQGKDARTASGNLDGSHG